MSCPIESLETSHHSWKMLCQQVRVPGRRILHRTGLSVLHQVILGELPIPTLIHLMTCGRDIHYFGKQVYWRFGEGAESVAAWETVAETGQECCLTRGSQGLEPSHSSRLAVEVACLAVAVVMMSVGIRVETLEIQTE